MHENIWFTKRIFHWGNSCLEEHSTLEQMHKKCVLPKETRDMSKKRNMSDVFKKDTKFTFGKIFERWLHSREKKLGGNFGSGESLEPEKRPGTGFELREPSRSEIVGIWEKNTYKNSRKREVQNDSWIPTINFSATWETHKKHNNKITLWFLSKFF